MNASGADDRPQFPGSRSKWIEKLEYLKPETYEGIPVYRVLDRKGKVINQSEDPKVSIASSKCNQDLGSRIEWHDCLILSFQIIFFSVHLVIITGNCFLYWVPVQINDKQGM